MALFICPSPEWLGRTLPRTWFRLKNSLVSPLQQLRGLEDEGGQTTGTPVLAYSEPQISSLEDCATRWGSCFHASDASTYNSTWLPSGSAKYSDFVTS